MIRHATPADAPSIARIYNRYVLHSTITFEEEPVGDAEMAARVREVADAGLPWLAAESGGALAGFAYAGKWKARSAYRHAVETSIYVAEGSQRQGLGRALYERLFGELRGRGLHTAIGGIALPNEASVALHEAFGMRKVAHFEQVGLKFGQRIDVGYWQLRL